MREPDFALLRSEVGATVRQPGFDTVRRRARRVRRRRAVAAGAAFLVVALATTGLGLAVRAASLERGGAGPAPVADGDPPGDRPRIMSVTSAGAELFVLLTRCTGCDPELHVSPDDGGSWQRRAVPPVPEDVADPRTAVLSAPAPGVVAWREIPADRPTAVNPLWITDDGGRTWRTAEVDMQPVAAVPAGSTPVDCAFVLRTSACRVAAFDPRTGRFAPLAAQPGGIRITERWTGDVTGPPGDRLWVPGVDPVTGRPAVATSPDAGRTWRTHTFTDAPVAEAGGALHVPQLAAGPDGTAYALTYRTSGVADTRYTTDGGVTWHAGDAIPDAWLANSFVTGDGLHVVSTYTGTVGGRGGGLYMPAALPGYPAAPAQTTQAADRRYLVTTESGLHLSADGRTWRQIRLP